MSREDVSDKMTCPTAKIRAMAGNFVGILASRGKCRKCVTMTKSLCSTVMTFLQQLSLVLRCCCQCSVVSVALSVWCCQCSVVSVAFSL
ncbi:hypothetical protein ElyMa_005849900 [Elysia marginata]|uniref:Uncharacterized protein n=1 Tax=Elysia marginata TaxID=1093978 RepID=A0AAV4FZT2_9GAST|nr:hypothetical protein ElyMa_005849900 [Elysia marginata]